MAATLHNYPKVTDCRIAVFPIDHAVRVGRVLRLLTPKVKQLQMLLWSLNFCLLSRGSVFLCSLLPSTEKRG